MNCCLATWIEAVLHFVWVHCDSLCFVDPSATLRVTVHISWRDVPLNDGQSGTPVPTGCQCVPYINGQSRTPVPTGVRFCKENSRTLCATFCFYWLLYMRFFGSFHSPRISLECLFLISQMHVFCFNLTNPSVFFKKRHLYDSLCSLAR